MYICLFIKPMIWKNTDTYFVFFVGGADEHIMERIKNLYQRTKQQIYEPATMSVQTEESQVR